MSKKSCGYENCPYKTLSKTERIIIPAVAGALILGKPFFGTVKAGLSPKLALAGFISVPVLDVSIQYFSLVLLSAWIIGIYLVFRDEPDHHWALVFQSFGVPGLIVAIVSLFAK